MTDALVSLRGIVKHFGELVAIHDATLDIKPGEVHALVGENGAGKSTLMNILYGLLPPTSGAVVLRGKPVSFGGPAEAIAAGIGMVHQHFKLAPSFTVAENIILGAEPALSGGRLDLRTAERDTGDLSQRFGLDLDPRAIVSTLPVGLRQRVEILKALYRQAEILILDEPTAVLTPQETAELFITMRSLAKSGRSVVFITHKLREVLAVSDRISVMRQGRIVSTLDNSEVTADQIASLMVGRTVLLRVAKTEAKPRGGPTLEISNLSVSGDRGTPAVEDLSLTVRPGEIVGLAGVQGNGQDELVESIAGIRRSTAGRIAICGTVPTVGDPVASRRAGLAYVPADRAHVGLSLQSSIWENMAVGHLSAFRKGPFLAAAAARRRCRELIKRFDIRGAGEMTPAGALSGGNQQKVQLARELTRDARLIIAEQPSQGVDIGAIESIHRLLVAMRDEGRAVFVISADLDELMSLCDRLLVIYRGRIVGDIAAADADVEEIGRLMGGSNTDDQAPTRQEAHA
ncbi:ABC transporter ATP-binding protein [Lichenifustis flavocetrariae]|uniref:ABC transporter ATP-binding protein n=1 Tax=Lichenifustis flavocetrariae TaxID=2949735 RepID=A0AA41Z0H9_9HYPH|nr:ABC transporter ATP-binding protein [Lichenifustis flavocetrariae]MCW6510605.1 ABC transporter ATP-binding protein [Lichenifustis flavocetrariae]